MVAEPMLLRRVPAGGLRVLCGRGGGAGKGLPSVFIALAIVALLLFVVAAVVVFVVVVLAKGVVRVFLGGGGVGVRTVVAALFIVEFGEARAAGGFGVTVRVCFVAVVVAVVVSGVVEVAFFAKVAEWEAKD